MFSSRFRWNLETNRLARAIEARRQAGGSILDLTESNPTRAGLRYPPQVVEALADQRALLYQPTPAGSDEARQAVSQYYAARALAVSPGRILLTASTSEAYAYLFKLLADPGDHVLVPRPSYPLFQFLADMESVEARTYRLAWHGEWSIDFDDLARALTSRTRAIVLVNPNNPTGSFVKPGELTELARLARSRGLALISDEVFSDYALPPAGASHATLAGFDECLAFAMSGLSKIAGLPQMKLGWIVVNGPEDLRRDAFARLEWIADTFLSVATPVQCAAARLLEAGMDVQAQIRARTARNLEAVRGALAGTAANVLPVEAGWYATIQVPRVRTEEEWTLALLERDGVLVQPGYFFDFETEAFLVASLLTPPEAFDEGIARVVRRLSAPEA
jgi:aspartate/methionine/tyrosine aminotransferase